MTKYGVIYGGVQKNIGPAGVVIVIAREDLITDDVLPGTPTMLKWKTQADKDSHATAFISAVKSLSG